MVKCRKKFITYTQFHGIKGEGGVLPHPPPKTLIEWMKFNGNRIHKILSTLSKVIGDWGGGGGGTPLPPFIL